MELINTYTRIWALLSSNERKCVIKLIPILIAMSLGQALSVGSLAPFLAVVANPRIVEEYPILYKTLTWLNAIDAKSIVLIFGIFAILVIVSANVISIFATLTSRKFSQNLGASIAIRLYQYYMLKPFVFHVMDNTAIFSKNITQECNRLTYYVIQPLLDLITYCALASSIIICLIFIEPYIVFICVLVLGPIYMIIYFSVRKKLAAQGTIITQELENGYRLISEGFGGIKEIKVFGKQNYFQERFKKSCQRKASAQIISGVIPLFPRYILEICAFGGMVFITLVLTKSHVDMVSVLPTLSIFALAGYRLIPAFQSFFALTAQIKVNINALGEIEKGIDPTNKILKPIYKNIKLQKKLNLTNIGYSYPGSREAVLKNVSLEIIAGQFVGFVGVTGSGKSTIIDLIVGLLQPKSGDIFIDDKKIDANSDTKWSNDISYVPQSIFLIDTTILSNIAFGEEKCNIDKQKVQNAAKVAGIDKFIESQPLGYETIVGERGAQLSGGERQRIGIARAIYKNSAILVLDEATSALDNVTEKSVINNLRNCLDKKTIIIIAHRMSTVEGCDRIFLINDGTINAYGTYEELFKTNVTFQKLIKSRTVT